MNIHIYWVLHCMNICIYFYWCIPSSFHLGPFVSTWKHLCCWRILLVFISLKTSLFLLYSWMFGERLNSRLERIFSLYLEDNVLSSFDFRGFWWEVCYQSCYCSFESNASLSLAAKILSAFGSQQFYHDVFRYGFLSIYPACDSYCVLNLCWFSLSSIQSSLNVDKHTSYIPTAC